MAIMLGGLERGGESRERTANHNVFRFGILEKIKSWILLERKTPWKGRKFIPAGTSTAKGRT